VVADGIFFWDKDGAQFDIAVDGQGVIVHDAGAGFDPFAAEGRVIVVAPAGKCVAFIGDDEDAATGRRAVVKRLGRGVVDVTALRRGGEGDDRDAGALVVGAVAGRDVNRVAGRDPGTVDEHRLRGADARSGCRSEGGCYLLQRGQAGECPYERIAWR
jgi:hypothetical protein